VVADELLEVTEEVLEERSTGSEANALGVNQGNIVSLHTANVIEIDSSTTIDSHSTSVSNYPTSSDMDDVPLNKIYEKLHKSLSPSSSTKLKKNPNVDTFEPMYPSVNERIHDMAQMRFKVCERLPANHPFQPPMIEPLSFVPADA
jgi:hypothetical protein